jgi:hypothetical protein
MLDAEASEELINTTRGISKVQLDGVVERRAC